MNKLSLIITAWQNRGIILKKLIQFDIWVNYKLLNGKEGETISSRLGRYIERDNSIKSWASKIFCRTVLLPLGILFDGSWKHCRESITEEHRDEPKE